MDIYLPPKMLPTFHPTAFPAVPAASSPTNHSSSPHHHPGEHSPLLPEAVPAAIDADLERHWYLLALLIVPLACIVGNTLVVAAVWTTRSLQTPTNYLLVSLACADLLVGSLVMPFSIYQAVNGLHWHLPVEVCHLYCVLDVAASTASIVNLVLISMDRLVAATKPAEYKSPKHKRRVYVAIGLTWVFSISLSLPLGRQPLL